MSKAKYQLLEKLRPEEYTALESDIAARGIMVPVEVDETGEILDGHNRAEIAKRLGKKYNTIRRTGWTEKQKHIHVIMLNLVRRHLDAHVWGGLFGRLLEIRGVDRKRGPKNKLVFDNVSKIAERTGTNYRAAYRRMAEYDAYKKLPPKLKRAVDNRDKTVTQAKREQKEQSRNERRAKNAAKVAKASSPKAILKSGAKFATIVIDPPWDWGDEKDVDQLGRARPTYETMPLEEIRKLPIAKLTDEDCHLYLWITNRSLPKGFGLIEEWGFRYITCVTWCKPSFGMGNYFRGSTEHLLFAIRGSQQLKRKDVGTWFAAPRGPRGHSSKPVAAYELIESCSPGPYLEMFARGKRKGWAGWGAES